MKNTNGISPIKFLGFVLLLLGLIFLTYGLIYLHNQNIVSNWKSTKGTVLSTQIKHFYASTGHTTTTTYYQLTVDYIYDVEGREYQSQSIPNDKAQDTAFYFDVEELQEQYRNGQEINIYYDPKEPGNSVLEVGDKKTVEQIFLISGIMIILSLIMLFHRVPRILKYHKLKTRGRR